MLSFTVGSAVPFKDYEGEWNPQCHWIVQPGEPIEAEFVQSLLDKYGPHVEAYAIYPFYGCSYSVDLQFHDPVVANECNQEYVRGWRKGGLVVTRKKAAKVKANKRLYTHRMYVLPDGTEFFYFSEWDGLGNLVGKVLSDVGSDEAGFVQLENRIEHRSLVEQATLVPRGKERFWLDDPATANERIEVHDALCELRAKNSPYGAGDTYYGERIEDVCKKLRYFSIGKIRSALHHLEEVDGFVSSNARDVWVNHEGWLAWSQWKDEFFLDIMFSESSQDWPDWEEQEFWKKINPSVWKKLDEEIRKEMESESEG